MAYNPYETNSYGGYSAYRQIGVKTASQGKLVVMLYDGAVTNLEKAMNLITGDSSISPGSVEPYGNYIQKVMDIITELQVSLDMEKGGEIAKNLMSLYVYFNKELLDSTISHDKKKLSQIHEMLSQLKESWETAASSTANTKVKTSQAAPSLNITG